MICSHCQASVADDALFCPMCGTSVAAAPPAQDPPEQEVISDEPTVFEQPTVPETIGNECEPAPIASKRPLIIGLIAAAVIAAVAVAAIFFFVGEPDPEPQPHGLYVKGDSLWYVDSSNGKSFEITNDLGDFTATTTDINDDEYEYSRLSSSDVLIIDNDTVFFPIDFTEGDDGVHTAHFTLCKADLEDGAEVIEIADEVTAFTASDDGEVVLYKTDDDKLYRFVDEESTKIASDVGQFELAYNGDALYYVVEKEDDDDSIDEYLYYQQGDEAEILLSSDYHNLYGADWDDFSTLIFLETNGKLYRFDNDEDKPRRIDSGVVDVSFCDDNDALYYLSENGAKDDYIGDYIKDPEEGNDWYAESPVYALYYYDGETSELIDDCVGARYFSDVSQGEEFTAVTYRSLTDVKKDSLEHISEAPLRFSVNGKTVAMTEAINDIVLADDGRTVAYVESSADGKTNTVYTATLQDTVLVNRTEIISGDNIDRLLFFEDGTLFTATVKEIKHTETDDNGDSIETVEYKYSYYLDGEELAKDVDYILQSWHLDGKVVFTEHEDHLPKKLYCFDLNARDIRLVDSTRNGYIKYDITGTGDLLYLVFDDSDDDTGTLYCYTNGDEILVDTDVSTILECYYRQ